MQLKTLGGLALEGSNLKRQRPLLLLAFVALQGGATRRELADLFFMHAADPRDSLSAAVNQLRRAAGDSLVLDDTTVTTNMPCDAVALLNDFDDFRFESVIKTYRGPFCAGYDQTLGEELEEWLFSTREQLGARARSALLHRSRVAAADGRVDEARRAVTAALSLTEAAPLTEIDVAELLPHVRALASPELATLEELATELGVEPAAATPALQHGQVVVTGRDRAAAGGHASANAPFVGRDSELAALTKLLESPSERIITIQGLGGIGKSRLADQVAELAAKELADSFPDGVHTVALETITSADDVPPAVAARLGFAPERVTATGGLAALLRNWQALVVMDNFETVIDASGWLSELAASCPGLRLLVTSRVRLGLTGERTFALHGLSVIAADGRASDAARLFIDRAARAGLSGVPSAAERVEIEALCVDLDGYPLGIELAAGMLRVVPLDKLRREIGRSLDALAYGPADAPERHRAVKAAFEPSWRRLERRERDAVLRLTVFRNGCDLDAARTVARADLETLRGLVDQAFLSHDSRLGRFTFHPLIREFVAEKRPEKLFHEASAAHRDVFAHVLEWSAAEYRSQPHVVLDRLAVEVPNVLRAVEWLLDRGDVRDAVTMLMRLVVECDYLEARGGGSAMVGLIERVAESAVVAGDLAAANRLLARAGDAYRLYTARQDEALRVYHRALELAELGEETDRCVTLVGLLGAMEVFRDPALALEYVRRAKELAVAAGDDLMLCDALNRSAYVAHALGAKDEMRLSNLRIVAMATGLLGDDRYSGQLPRIESNLYFALHNLGVAEDDLGMLSESLEHRNQALEFAEQRGHHLWQGYAHEELTFLHLQLGDVSAADAHARAARDNFERIGAESSLLRLRERLRTEGGDGLIADGRSRTD